MAGLPGFDSFKDDINSCSAWYKTFSDIQPGNQYFSHLINCILHHVKGNGSSFPHRILKTHKNIEYFQHNCPYHSVSPSTKGFHSGLETLAVVKRGI